MNPSGALFAVRCYSQAEGVALSGELSDEYTWFPPYRWRFAHCAHCAAHLGWSFAASDAFWAFNDEALTLG